ncbi:terminase small subunit [Agrococcus sp. DT81.2]|uniref:terminase small subunit n=1 Tax=Agrococcus sp. DT81.2 TaxID=3393414 RepID=UPI003CE55320
MALSADERRERNRERMRAVRAAGRAERDAERDTARRALAAAAPRTMRDALESSIAAMKWLAPSDAACVAQARSVAGALDELRYAGDHDRALAAHRLLSRLLADLGATPMARMRHELRSLRSTGGVDVEGEDVAGPARPANVTSITRPAKRRRD